MSHDIRFPLEKAERSLLGIYRAVLRMGYNMRSAMQGMNHGIHKNLILQPAAPSGTGYRVCNPRHVFNSSGKYDICHAGLNHRHP
jgi:hypothetical protein